MCEMFIYKIQHVRGAGQPVVRRRRIGHKPVGVTSELESTSDGPNECEVTAVVQNKRLISPPPASVHLTCGEFAPL